MFANLKGYLGLFQQGRTIKALVPSHFSLCFKLTDTLIEALSVYTLIFFLSAHSQLSPWKLHLISNFSRCWFRRKCQWWNYESVYIYIYAGIVNWPEIAKSIVVRKFNKGSISVYRSMIAIVCIQCMHTLGLGVFLSGPTNGHIKRKITNKYFHHF